jgi:hypothetical protein
MRIIRTVRYHIYLDSHRTTVSLDKIVSDLMAIKLGYLPDSTEAHQAVSKRLNQLVKDKGRDGYRLTYHVTQEAILDLVDNRLSTRYQDFWLASFDAPQKHTSTAGKRGLPPSNDNARMDSSKEEYMSH